MTIDMMLRDIQVSIDEKSWGGKKVPEEIARMNTVWKASVVLALIHTAL